MKITMTVQQIVPYAKYVTNGADSVYTVNFFIEDKKNLFIKLNDVVVSMNDYNYLKDVNGIEFHTPLLANQKLEIFRKTKLERTTNFESFNNTFRPEVLNKDLDKIWLTLQEQSSKVDQYDLDYEYVVRTSSQALTEVKDAQARADDAYELADLTNTEIRPIPRGGTGANNASDARNNLDVHSKAEVLALVQTGGAGEVLSIESGGTGGMTVEAARTNLDVYSQSDTDEKIETAIAAFPNATEVVKGKAKIATTEIAKAGINDTDFITPLKLKHGLNATGNAPISACRAWVVFTCVSNVVTILNSMNILSVTRLGTSNFKITYATPMPTANNVPLASGQAVIGTNNQYAMAPAIRNILAESCEAYHHTPSADFPLVTLGVFC